MVNMCANNNNNNNSDSNTMLLQRQICQRQKQRTRLVLKTNAAYTNNSNNNHDNRRNMKLSLLLLFTLSLLQQMSGTWCTRLPLEVYELTTTLGIDLPYNHSVSNSSNNRSRNMSEADELHNLKHKRLEYTTIDAKTLTAVSGGGGGVGQEEVHIETTIHDATTAMLNVEHRRSRQMLDNIAQQQQKLPQHRFNIDNNEVRNQTQQQQQQQQQNDVNTNSNNNNNNIYINKLSTRKHNRISSSGSDSGTDSDAVRILYQVGESEDDLPICAPNAVCSKIDLYETPWIERQCRCPDVSRQPLIVLHHHHHQHHLHHSNAHHHNSHAHHNNNHHPHQQQQQQQQHPHVAYAAAAAAAVNGASNSVHSLQHATGNNGNYHSYLEKERLLQRKHLMAAESAVEGRELDKKLENLHLRKLMAKLGAIYEDDLQLHASDYVMREDNETLPNDDEDDDEPLAQDEQLQQSHDYNPASPPPPPQQRRNNNNNNNVGSSYATHMRHHTQSGRELIGGCPSGLGSDDGHTIADKTRHYKLCQPVHKLPVCKHFRDYTWTLTTSVELNVTEQIVHCRCPRNSVTYLTKREPAADGASGYTYLFACSPLTRLRCQRKQPCKLFTVRKRQEFLDEVNINALCQCPKAHHCPSHHTQSGVIPGESYLEDNIQTYSGYCMAND